MGCLASFFTGNVLAQTPKVVTDTRYARGATMAFGRIKSTATNGGTAIQKRGFCLSEKAEPTIDDIVNIKQLANNGVIYYFENLKPSTKYYMRAYATNKNGETGYGDVIKFYTLPMGNVTYWYNNGGDDAANKRVNAAAQEACDIFNNLTEIQKKFNIGYSAGTPTADCYYADEPWMNMGANSSYQRTGTIMHEMQHGLGMVPYSTQWNKDILRERLDGDGRGSGHWIGDRVSDFLNFWDNAKNSQLNGDYQHMWPYGINGAHEDDGTLVLYYANAMIGQALGEDGLEHRSNTFAEPYYALNQEDTIKYYIKNESADRGRSTSFLKPNVSGALKWAEMTADEAEHNDSAAWYITFTPENQYYQLRNAATGKFLTYSGGIKTLERDRLTASDNWQLMRGRVDVDGQRAYWIIHPEDNWTPRCLQANVNGNVVPATFNLANSAETQRWLIMTMADTRAAEAEAMALMTKVAEEALAKVKTLAEVPHTEDVAGTDAQLQTALVDIEAAIAKAESVTQLSALVTQAEKAGLVFLQGVTPSDTEKPFDLTWALTNPTVDETADGWTGSAAVKYGCAEFYQQAFDFSQTVSNLPKGTYAFCAQGFQRPGSNSAVYKDFKAGTNQVNAVIYAGDYSEKLANVCDEIQTRKVGKGTEAALTSGRYVPNDMQSASAYFQKGFYENRVLTQVSTDKGSLKVGIKSTSMPGNYWAIFDNFRLYFYGSRSMGDVTDIHELLYSPSGIQPETPVSVYDLQGRQVKRPSKGIYVVNGKKVVVK